MDSWRCTVRSCTRSRRTLMAGEDTDIVVALLVSGSIMPYSKSDISMERDADLKPHSLGHRKSAIESQRELVCLGMSSLPEQGRCAHSTPCSHAVSLSRRRTSWPKRPKWHFRGVDVPSSLRRQQEASGPWLVLRCIISEEERLNLLESAEKQKRQGLLLPNPAGPHRFFRRLDATGGVDSFLEELTERLEDAVAGLHGRQLDPTLGRVCSYIEPGGFIHEHRDRYHAQTDGLAHLRANIVVQMEPKCRASVDSSWVFWHPGQQRNRGPGSRFSWFAAMSSERGAMEQLQDMRGQFYRTAPPWAVDQPAVEWISMTKPPFSNAAGCGSMGPWAVAANARKLSATAREGAAPEFSQSHGNIGGLRAPAAQKAFPTRQLAPRGSRCLCITSFSRTPELTIPQRGESSDEGLSGGGGYRKGKALAPDGQFLSTKGMHGSSSLPENYTPRKLFAVLNPESCTDSAGRPLGLSPLLRAWLCSFH
ncbi:unnamed protein product [Symbiodinium necroappetens]|uniref:Uncharacterized protein n=1 Tax=Symbiodinium necroappetens TaxID=1628268 RepID=A0A813BL29_9DINO|nr:unnamed protein product [Symbiodinium necroappetens]